MLLSRSHNKSADCWPTIHITWKQGNSDVDTRPYAIFKLGVDFVNYNFVPNSSIANDLWWFQVSPRKRSWGVNVRRLTASIQYVCILIVTWQSLCIHILLTLRNEDRSDPTSTHRNSTMDRMKDPISFVARENLDASYALSNNWSFVVRHRPCYSIDQFTSYLTVT